MPEPQPDTMKHTAATISTARRPYRSARRPAKNAPAAQPSSMDATLKPVPIELEWKACSRPSTVPLMTPLSKPNRKPPIVATRLIRMIRPVFSPSLPARLPMSPPCMCLQPPCQVRHGRPRGRAGAAPARPSAQQVKVEQVLVGLLAAAGLLRFARGLRVRAQRGKIQLAVLEVPARSLVEAGVALLAP